MEKTGRKYTLQWLEILSRYEPQTGCLASDRRQTTDRQRILGVAGVYERDKQKANVTDIDDSDSFGQFGSNLGCQALQWV